MRAAARRFGILVALNPRRTDLMTAAAAAAHGLPLLTRNADGFEGLGQGVEIIAA